MDVLIAAKELAVSRASLKMNFFRDSGVGIVLESSGKVSQRIQPACNLYCTPTEGL